MHIVVGNDDADILFFEFGDDMLDVFHSDRVHAGEGFVEEDELGVGGQTAGDFHTAALATRQVVAFVFTNLLNVEFGDKALQTFFSFRLVAVFEL